MSIKWTKSGYGFNGTIPGYSIYSFKIYEPGDPCNHSNIYELLNHDYKDKEFRTQHANLEAAKRAARRQVAKARPRPELVWYNNGDHLRIGKYPDDTGWFIADDYVGSGKLFAAERLHVGGDKELFHTMAEAVAYCEKKGPK